MLAAHTHTSYCEGVSAFLLSAVRDSRGAPSCSSWMKLWMVEALSKSSCPGEGSEARRAAAQEGTGGRGWRVWESGKKEAGYEERQG